MEGHNIVRLWRRARSCAWPGPGWKDADGWKTGLDAEMIKDKLDSLTTKGSSLQFSGWHVDTALLPASPAKGTGRANERQSQVTGGSWVSWWQYICGDALACGLKNKSQQIIGLDWLMFNDFNSRGHLVVYINRGSDSRIECLLAPVRNGHFVGLTCQCTNRGPSRIPIANSYYLICWVLMPTDSLSGGQ